MKTLFELSIERLWPTALQHNSPFYDPISNIDSVVRNPNIVKKLIDRDIVKFIHGSYFLVSKQLNLDEIALHKTSRKSFPKTPYSRQSKELINPLTIEVNAQIMQLEKLITKAENDARDLRLMESLNGIDGDALKMDHETEKWIELVKITSCELLNEYKVRNGTDNDINLKKMIQMFGFDLKHFQYNEEYDCFE